MPQLDGCFACNSGPHDWDYVFKGVKLLPEYSHQVCRRIRARDMGTTIEIEFADGKHAVVPRRMVKNISDRRAV